MLLYTLFLLAAFSTALLLMALARAVRVFSLRGLRLLVAGFLERIFPPGGRLAPFRTDRRVLKKPWGW